MMQALVLTRMTGYTPLVWHRTAGFGLDKGSYSAGPEKKRVIHVLDPMGKAFFASLMANGPKPILPQCWHGYAAGRRRESAMMTQMIM